MSDVVIRATKAAERGERADARLAMIAGRTKKPDGRKSQRRSRELKTQIAMARKSKMRPDGSHAYVPMHPQRKFSVCRWFRHAEYVLAWEAVPPRERMNYDVVRLPDGEYETRRRP